MYSSSSLNQHLNGNCDFLLPVSVGTSTWQARRLLYLDFARVHVQFDISLVVIALF
jgi:hypothetical protein